MLTTELIGRITFAAIVLFSGYALIHVATGKHDHAALLFVAFVGTTGWLFTAHIARHNQIEKNTFDLIYSYNRDTRYVALRETVWRHFGPYTVIDQPAAQKLVKDYFDNGMYRGEAFPVGYHLIQIANFYEYLAIGISAGLLSEEIAQRYFATTLRVFYLTKAGFVIAEIRKRPNAETAFSEMLALLVAWHPDIKLKQAQP